MASLRERLFTLHHHKNRTLTTRSATGEVLRVGEKNVEFVQSYVVAMAYVRLGRYALKRLAIKNEKGK